MNKFFERVKRASRRSPRYLAGRLVEAGRARFRRPWTRIYPHLLTEQSVVKAAGAHSSTRIGTTLQRSPFFVNTADRPQVTEAFRARYPDAAAAIVAAAESRRCGTSSICSAPGCVSLGPALPWHPTSNRARLAAAVLARTSTTWSSIARPT